MTVTRRIVAASASVLLTAVGAIHGTGASAEPTPAIVHEGTIPLTATTVAGAASGNMPDGRPRTWAVVSGSPAYLAEINPVDGTLVETYPLEGAGGAWGVELAADGTVWVASYSNGRLYYLAPGAGAVVNAGAPTPGTSFLWQVDTDADGIAYTGTFQGFAPAEPAARLAAYDRSTGQYRDYGTFGDQYAYTRATAVLGDTVYVGMGTTAAIFAVDIETGEKREIPLPISGCQFAYEMATSGTDLYVRFECTKKNYGYVYDTVTGTWSEQIVNYLSQRIGRDTAGTTYFVTNSQLNARTPDGTITALDAQMGAKGIGVVTADGREYVVGITNSLLSRYDIASGASTQIAVPLEGTPVRPRAAAWGPDERLHIGGYFSGGLASFDPNASSEPWSFDPRLGQPEGLVKVGSRFYAGVYPGARIYEVDPTRPLTDGNPKLAFELTDENQDRPFAMAEAGTLLAVGTVPGYGSLKSALALHDPDTGATRVFEDLIEDQSIIALAYADGVLYGGTSVWGGAGIEPTQADAVVFAFDVSRQKLLWTRTIPGQRQVVAVETTPGGQVYAASRGTLVALKQDTGRIVSTHTIAPYDWSKFSGGTWNGVSLVYNEADRTLYGATADKIFRADPVGRRRVQVLEGMSGAFLTVGPRSRVYWVDGQQLYSTTWPGRW
jgi:outer membrane protein assembly factor BamB